MAVDVAVHGIFFKDQVLNLIILVLANPKLFIPMARVKSIAGLLYTYLVKTKTVITAKIKQILRICIFIEYEKH